jgi:hypothetical protein
MALPNTAYRWRGLWVNGDNYYNYDAAQSPITSYTYVLDNGNSLAPSVLDPSADARWKLLSVPPSFPPAHGGFISTISQTLTAATPLYMVYDTTTSSLGCSLVLGTGGALSAIQVANTGVYQITFSIQWDKFGGGGTDNVQAWFAINGTAVPSSNSEIDITQQINQVTTVDIILTLLAGDKLEIVGYTPAGTQVRALAQVIDATHPVAIPSIITSITRIS